MKKTERRRGPAPRLDRPLKFTTNLTEDTRDWLFDYAARHGISVAETVRRAVAALKVTDKEAV